MKILRNILGWLTQGERIRSPEYSFEDALRDEPHQDHQYVPITGHFPRSLTEEEGKLMSMDASYHKDVVVKRKRGVIHTYGLLDIECRGYKKGDYVSIRYLLKGCLLYTSPSPRD